MSERAERKPADQSVQVVYIGGVGRSGSTLLDRMLGQLDGFCSVGELVHLWERGLREDSLCGCGTRFSACPFWTRVGKEAFGGWERLPIEDVLALKRSVDRNRYVPLLLAPALWPPYQVRLRHFSELLVRLYLAIQQVSGEPMTIDATKHPSYALLLRQVPTIDLRILHLVRDSRGVAFSWAKRIRRADVVGRVAVMARRNPSKISGRWLWDNSLFHLLRALGVPSLLLRYEELVRHPQAEMERILQHLGRAPGHGELAFIHDRYIELHAAHALAGNPIRFLHGRMSLRLDEDWRQHMRPGQRAVTSFLTWPLLLRYGYIHGHQQHPN